MKKAQIKVEDFLVDVKSNNSLSPEQTTKLNSFLTKIFQIIIFA